MKPGDDRRERHGDAVQAMAGVLALLFVAVAFTGLTAAHPPDVVSVNVNPPQTPVDGAFTVSAVIQYGDHFLDICPVDYAEWWVEDTDPPGFTDPGQGNGSFMQLQFQSPCSWLAAGFPTSPVDLGMQAGFIYTICVRARGAPPPPHTDNWSAPDCGGSVEVLTADTEPPDCTYIAAIPNFVDQASGFLVNISATFDDQTTGGTNIQNGEYLVVPPDDPPFTGTSTNGSWRQDWDDVNPPIGFWGVTPVASATKFFDFSSFITGTYDVYAHGQDSSGNWGHDPIDDNSPYNGQVCKVTVTVDNPTPAVQGPAVSGLTLFPNPVMSGDTTFLQGFADDSRSGNNGVVAAEWCWMGSCGANGTNNPMSPSDGGWGEVNETIEATVDTTGRPLGAQDVCVHARDDQNAWGDYTCATLVISDDIQGPVTNPCSLSVSVLEEGTPGPIWVNATVDDSTTGGTTIAAAEYFFDVPGPDGTGTAMDPADGNWNTVAEDVTQTFNPAALGPGSYTFYVHGQDSKSNWGAYCTAMLTITPKGGGSLLPPDNPWISRIAADLVLTWGPPAGGTEDRYNIYGAVNNVNGFSFTTPYDTVMRTSCTGGGCSWTDPASGEGTDANAYFYIVRSSDGATEETNTLKLGKFAQDLVKGYNDVSVPFEQQDTTTTVVFSSISGSYDSIGSFGFWAGCGSPGSWRFWNTTGTQNLVDSDHTMGFRIRVTVNSVRLINVGRVATSTTIMLCGSPAGGGTWNFVGYPKLTDGDLPDVLDQWGLNNPPRSYDLVSYRDAKDKRDPWKIFDPDDPSISDLTILRTGMGIWILMLSNDTWTPPGDGTP